MTERHVDGAEAGADRGRDRALECHLVAPDRVERFLGQGRSGGLHHVDARLLHVPVEGDTGRFENAARSLGELRPCPVAGTKGDAVRSRELAASLGALRLIGASTLQCSVIAERKGDPRLALFYAERALGAAEETGDRRTEARLLNNIGGLTFLLGQPEVAVARFTASYSLFFELGFDLDAAQVVSSLAQIHLRCGAPQLAEEQARHALSILERRADYVEE